MTLVDLYLTPYTNSDSFVPHPTNKVIPQGIGGVLTAGAHVAGAALWAGTAHIHEALNKEVFFDVFLCLLFGYDVSLECHKNNYRIFTTVDRVCIIVSSWGR